MQLEAEEEEEMVGEQQAEPTLEQQQQQSEEHDAAAPPLAAEVEATAAAPLRLPSLAAAVAASCSAPPVASAARAAAAAAVAAAPPRRRSSPPTNARRDAAATSNAAGSSGPPPSPPTDWTPAEDALLKQGVAMFGRRPCKVALVLLGRPCEAVAARMALLQLFEVGGEGEWQGEGEGGPQSPHVKKRRRSGSRLGSTQQVRKLGQQSGAKGLGGAWDGMGLCCCCVGPGVAMAEVCRG